MTAAGDGTVGKALDVLDLVAAQERPVRFADLHRMSPLPKATLYRLAQTLVSQGMLVQNTENGTYSLGVRLVRLAHAAWRHASLAPIARRHLDILSQSSKLTVHLAQMEAGHVLYVDKRNLRESVQMFSEAGKVGPAYCTGVGKAMLAYMSVSQLDRTLRLQSFHRYTPKTVVDEAALRLQLERIRSRGFARDREEHEPGIICVAVPIFTANDRVLGAVSVSGTVIQTDFKTLEAQVPGLRQCADAIAEDAMHWDFPADHMAEFEGRQG